MIDEQRAAEWTKDAGAALMRKLGKNQETSHLAAVVLALLEDRKEREDYCSRISSMPQRFGPREEQQQ